MTMSVNALNGLLSISTIKTKEENIMSYKVSMPSTGFYPFLRDFERIMKMMK